MYKYAFLSLTLDVWECVRVEAVSGLKKNESGFTLCYFQINVIR